MEPPVTTNRLKGDNLTPRLTQNWPNRDRQQCDSNHELLWRLIDVHDQRTPRNNRRESEMFLRGTIPGVCNHYWCHSLLTVLLCQSHKWNDSNHHNAYRTTPHPPLLCIVPFHWYCSVDRLPNSSRIWARVNSNFFYPRACQVNPARATVSCEWNSSHCQTWWIVTSYPNGFLRFDSPVLASQHHVWLVVNYDSTAAPPDSRVIGLSGWISCRDQWKNLLQRKSRLSDTIPLFMAL